MAQERKMSGGVVAVVEPGSLADSLGIRPGDVLLEINGHALRDVLDVQFYAADEELALRVVREGLPLLYRTERDYAVSLGLTFASPTFDGMRRCSNRCAFCFVAQMPPGLRRSLYVRDDDYRYSVLYGSFITLTHLTSEDWARLAEQRLSPLYISVHATEPGLRRKLLGRDDIPDILPQIDRLAGLGIQMHTQIVLVPGVNDGCHLSQTVQELADRYPALQSIGVVPVGLTRYHRQGCRPHTRAEMLAAIEQVEGMQRGYRARHGVSLVYLADEWYLATGAEPPPDALYDGYPQIENGIGLVRQFLEDSEEVRTAGTPKVSSCTLVCGTLIAPIMEQLADKLAARTGARVAVVPVINRLFGPTVTVSGLLGGEDVVAALQDRELGEVVFLPAAMFAETYPGQDGLGLEGSQSVAGASRDEERRTLDGLTFQDITDRVVCEVVLVSWMSEVWSRMVGDPREPTT